MKNNKINPFAILIAEQESAIAKAPEDVKEILEVYLEELKVKAAEYETKNN